VSYNHTTLFKARRNESISRSGHWQDTAARWVPPAIYDSARGVLNKARERRRCDP
jgi:hypothetical protein